MATESDPVVRPALTPHESRRYWDRRHRQSGDLASGGHIGMDEGTNAMLYAVRLARLIEVLGPYSNPRAPLHVLDAGCGKGHFSRALASFGHRVTGIDTSSHAIEVCRTAAGPRETYAVSSLTEWQPPALYDAVVSIDVLYHLMDDEEWFESLRNLASLVRLGGILGVVDHDNATSRVWANYQKTRSSTLYREHLEGWGFEVRRGVRNDFRNDPSIMHVATRVA